MEQNEHLLKYEQTLTEILVNLCTSKGFLNGHLLQVEELEEKWGKMAPEYMFDAVPEVNSYPAVAIAWASYLGMGLAAMWDGAWDEFAEHKELYKYIRDPRGFDSMDEFIMEKLLGIDLDSDECKSMEELFRSCAHSAMALIRNEKFEPQSSDAFYVFASTVKVFFRLGIAIELKQLGYEYRKMEIPVIN